MAEDFMVKGRGFQGLGILGSEFIIDSRKESSRNMGLKGCMVNG